MNDKVTYLDSYRPHLTIRGATGNVYVIPEEALARMAHGDLPLEDNEDMIRGIIRDFLHDLNAEYD